MAREKQRDGRFKAQVALEAIKNEQTTSQIASEYGVNLSNERLVTAIAIP